MNIRLEKSWLNALKDEFERPYFKVLTDAVKKEYGGNTPIYPKGSQIFRALDMLPIDKVRVVILGQDPYHGEGQAEGLAFSVPKGVTPPPSLVNIKKEIQNDLGSESIIKDGNLIPWVNQGVLLLNTTLTVRQSQPGSHANIGWETFTDAIINILNKEKKNIVFMLWGAHAKRKGAMIDRHKHLVLEAPHPSPLSVYRGFYGCKHFSKANTYLISKDFMPIHW